MKYRAHVLVLLSVFMLGFVPAAEAMEVKIGVVEPQKIFEGTKKGKKIKEMLADYVQVRQRVIESEEADLKKLEEELVNQGSVLSASAKTEKEQTFQQKMAAYQRRVQDLEGEVQTKRREVLGDFTKVIEQVVREIAEKEKIILVLEIGGLNTGAPILYYQDSLDLTARVIKALDGKGGE